jgi:hypothetical protein
MQPVAAAEGGLQFALGKCGSEPGPTPDGTAQVLRFATESQVTSCKAELQEGAGDVLVEADGEHSGW